MSPEDDKLQTSKSIDGLLSIFFGKKLYVKKQFENFMFVCTTVLYEYMNLLRNDVYNLFVNMHVRIKIYLEFYYGIIYIANEVHHVRINN